MVATEKAEKGGGVRTSGSEPRKTRWGRKEGDGGRERGWEEVATRHGTYVDVE